MSSPTISENEVYELLGRGFAHKMGITHKGLMTLTPERATLKVEPVLPNPPAALRIPATKKLVSPRVTNMRTYVAAQRKRFKEQGVTENDFVKWALEYQKNYNLHYTELFFREYWNADSSKRTKF